VATKKHKQDREVTLNSEAIAKAAQYFVEARAARSGRPPLPPELQPANADDGHAIQDATVAALKETVGGWKVGLDKAAAMTRAPIFASLIHANHATIAASSIPLKGIEAEIAFRFTRDLPRRDAAYTREEVSEAVQAFAAIELLNSRYAEPAKRSPLEKLADCIVQGGIVCGVPIANWRAIDFSKLDVVLTVDGAEIARRTGSHPTGDPVPPMVALVNALRQTSGVKAGQIMTTGTWTGVNYVQDTSKVVATFAHFEPVSFQFTA
jgi:2-keto-4-pentenoate hydratase